MKKILKNTLESFKKSLVVIIIFSIFLSLELFELDYSIFSPGGLINIEERLSNEEYSSTGSFNMTYVTSRKGTILNLIIASFLPDHDILKNDSIKLSNEDMNDMYNREVLQIRESISNATYISYNHANKSIYTIDEEDYVYYISDKADTELKVGDRIIKCNNKDIYSHEELQQCINSLDDEVILDVIRNKKSIKVKSKILKEDESKYIGILVSRIFNYDIDPKIEYDYKKSESGSSGGLMLALAMYNSLTSEDITKGYKIAGTGTIDRLGNVGEISGIKYKLIGAYKKNADIFIVPSDNYEEAKEIVNNSNYKIDIIKADNFYQVLEELKNYNKN